MAIEKLPATGDMPRSTGIPASVQPGGAADSAGYPWQGRNFDHHETAFAHDDGSMPRQWQSVVTELRNAAEIFQQHTQQLEHSNDPTDEHVAALAEAQTNALVTLSSQRLLVPLITDAGDFGLTPEGRTVEKTQELSIVTIQAPDGRTAMPVFSSVETMRQWNAEARPIPMPAPQIALAAASEHTDLIIVDAASPDWQFGVRRTQLEAVARALPVSPAWFDGQVQVEMQDSVVNEPHVRFLQLLVGDPQMRLLTPEVTVLLELEPGLQQTEVEQLIQRLQHSWAVNETIAGRVDSMTLKLR